MTRLSANKIKWIKALQEKKFRDELGLFVVEGEKMVLEALNNHIDHIEFIVQTEKTSTIELNKKVENFICSENEFQRISSLKHPQGCLAVLKKTLIHSLPKSGRLIIALDGIQDPGNLGTILRIADWFGISDIVCSKDTVDCYNPKVVQASMGAILRVTTFYTDLKSWLEKVESPIYGALLDGKNIYGESLIDDAVLLLGNEGRGIREELKSTITHPIAIPSFGGAESLNVSVAAGVIISEFRRRNV